MIHGVYTTRRGKRPLYKNVSTSLYNADAKFICPWRHQVCYMRCIRTLSQLAEPSAASTILLNGRTQTAKKGWPVPVRSRLALLDCCR